jgi:hypothetical protein
MDGAFRQINSHFWVKPPDIRRAGVWPAGHRRRMNDFQKFQRACRVFLARLLLVYGTDAPTILRRMADELEQLQRDELN